MELVDIADLKSVACKGVWVQVPPSPPFYNDHFRNIFLFIVNWDSNRCYIINNILYYINKKYKI